MSKPASSGFPRPALFEREMADGVNDFVLFPRHPAYLDMSEHGPDHSFSHLQFHVGSDLRQVYSAPHGSMYDSFSPMPVYGSGQGSYNDAPELYIDGIAEKLKQNQSSYTPSVSPSTSMSQSLGHAPSVLSSTSCASLQSTTSSAVGSPHVPASQNFPHQGQWIDPHHGLGIGPEINHHQPHNTGFEQDSFPVLDMDCSGADVNQFDLDKSLGNCVDPSLIQSFDTPITHNTAPATFSGAINTFQPAPNFFNPPSPAPSDSSSQDSCKTGSRRYRSGNASPYLHSATFQPYPPTSQSRKMSISSSHSRHSLDSPRSTSVGLDDDGKERGRCPNPECGRYIKDLKAHMLTHQSERPEKCPITTCDYHQKGFARKYDKNRHTLTHYKGTMVCPFCPGSGSAVEKSFNRADVFKRHLTSVHGVEQSPPNSRKKSPSVTSVRRQDGNTVDECGKKCSTCSAAFSNAQDFYEHLDDCVLRVVQQEEPSEAINEQNLSAIAGDFAVQETLGRHMLPSMANSYMPQDESRLKEEDEEEPMIDEEREGGSGNENGWMASRVPNTRVGGGVVKSVKGVHS